MISILNTWSTYPPKSGGQQAIYGLYGHLNQLLPCQYVYLTEGQQKEFESSVLPNGLPSISVCANEAREGAARWLVPGILFRHLFIKQAIRFGMSAIIRSRLAQVTANSQVICLSHPWMWPAIRHHVHGKFVVYDAQNVEYRMAQTGTSTSGNSAASNLAIRKIEGDLVRRADLILTCTPDDAATMIDLYGVTMDKIFVGHIGTDGPAQTKPISAEPQSRPRAAFVGSNWPPNNDAASFIAGTLASQLPEVDFLIFGGCCASVDANNLPGNVQLMGFVDDLRASLSTCDMALNPITSGSGINVKVLEYLSVGLPVITTAFGARGITSESLDFLPCVPLGSFASQIRAVLHARAQWHHWSQSAQAFISHRFSWPVIARSLAQTLVNRAPQLPSRTL